MRMSRIVAAVMVREEGKCHLGRIKHNQNNNLRNADNKSRRIIKPRNQRHLMNIELTVATLAAAWTGLGMVEARGCGKERTPTAGTCQHYNQQRDKIK